VKYANVEEAENGYMVTCGEDGEYPGTKHVAADMDEVLDHLKKHFSGKGKKKEGKKKVLGSLAKH